MEQGRPTEAPARTKCSLSGRSLGTNDASVLGDVNWFWVIADLGWPRKNVSWRWAMRRRKGEWAYLSSDVQHWPLLDKWFLGHGGWSIAPGGCLKGYDTLLFTCTGVWVSVRFSEYGKVLTKYVTEKCMPMAGKRNHSTLRWCYYFMTSRRVLSWYGCWKY